MRRPLTVSGFLGLAIIGFNLLLAIAGPYFAPYPYTEIVGPAWAAPDGAHPFGLDNLGRDLLSRLLFGARNSIGIAFLIAFLSVLLGVSGGFFAAIRGGKIDLFLSRVFELFLAMPTLIFVLMILSVFGTSAPVLIITLGLIDSTRVYRLARLVAERIMAEDYTEAALLRGEGNGWIMLREILPNSLAPLISELGLRFSFTFLLIAALSYLGLGIQPPAADWGNMVRDNAQVIALGRWAALYPAFAIALLAAGVNMTIDWLVLLPGSAAKESH